MNQIRELEGATSPTDLLNKLQKYLYKNVGNGSLDESKAESFMKLAREAVEKAVNCERFGIPLDSSDFKYGAYLLGSDIKWVVNKLLLMIAGK